MITVKQWNTFSRTLKAPHNLVKSVYEIDIANFDQCLKEIKSLEAPVLVTEAFSIRPSSEITDKYSTAFTVLMQLHQREQSPETKEDLLADTQQIIFAIRRLMLDLKESSQCTLMRNLEPRSISINKVGPLADSMFGWRMTFDIIDEF